MCYVEQIFSAARRPGADAFIVEAGAVPRWVSNPAPFALSDEVPSDVLTAFLFRTMPSSAQARLAMGHLVEFRARIQGADWNLRAESTEQGFFVHVSPVQTVEESMSYCLIDEEAAGLDGQPAQRTPRVEPSFGDGPPTPPPNCARSSNRAENDSLSDAFDQICLSPQERPTSHLRPGRDRGEQPGPDAWGGNARASNVASPGAGIPGFVEDSPFGGVASGPISLGFQDPSFQGQPFDAVGTLLLVNSKEVMAAALAHLRDPEILVRDNTSLFDTYAAIDLLSEGSCICVDVEDPSVWFSWVMRRLEQGCTVLVLCRAFAELGAMRVLCGLNPEVPAARWLAEHRRVFLASADAVTSLFVSYLDRASSAS